MGATIRAIEIPIVFTPDEWTESWIPQVLQLDYEINSKLADVSTIGSYTRQVIPVARSWTYELVLPLGVASKPIGTTGTLAYGQSDIAMSQRVLFAGEQIDKEYRILQLIGTEPPALGIHMPKLVRFRFELGDGTFIQMVLAEHEMHTFNKQEYIERVYGKH